MNLSAIYENILNCHGLLAYLYGNGMAFAPLRIQLEVTGMCNLRCEFCCQDQDYKCGKEELTLSEIKSVIDQVPRFTLLTFSGGEPLLRKDIKEIISYALERKHFCNISTNGVLLNNEIIELLVRKGFLAISVSLDGMGEIHDKLRGVPQTFSKVKNNLIALSRSKKEQKKKFPLLDIKTIITDKNIDELVKLYSFCESISADFFTLSLLKINQAQFNPSSLKDNIEDEFFYRRGSRVNLETSRLISALEQLEKLKGKTKIRLYPRFRSLKELQNFLAGKCGSQVSTSACLEPWSSFQINAFGRAYPCLSYKVGNVKEQTLKEIWGSERFVSFRRRLKKIKLFPSCDGCCYLKMRI
ncbi:MAG: radical SAM protein [Candidatus Omnitrophica bacterium]|nr:radical SAM protein [Candidatus Omnitrophota bacterium]